MSIALSASINTSCVTIPAPLPDNSISVRSKTSTCHPDLRRAAAANKPPIEPPQIIAFFIIFLKERLFIVAEIGNDDKKILNENINANFKGSYLKAGFNYNFYNNPPGLENEIYFGFRFATSSFKSEVFDYLVYDLDKYWENGRIEDYSEYNNLSANWIELILGFNAKISKNIFMGTSLRLNRMINQKSPENFGNLYIPGFNIVTEDNNFGTGITYTLTYRIPIVKK